MIHFAYHIRNIMSLFKEPMIKSAFVTFSIAFAIVPIGFYLSTPYHCYVLGMAIVSCLIIDAVRRYAMYWRTLSYHNMKYPMMCRERGMKSLQCAVLELCFVLGIIVSAIVGLIVNSNLI